MKPEMTNEQANQVLATSTAPKVTKEGIQAKIFGVEYLYHGVMTICIITMKNGFQVHDASACASPENFNAELGRKIAYDKAFSQIWALEGYLLREKLSGMMPPALGEAVPAA